MIVIKEEPRAGTRGLLDQQSDLRAIGICLLKSVVADRAALAKERKGHFNGN
jgi:hypothetical protein